MEIVLDRELKAEAIHDRNSNPDVLIENTIKREDRKDIQCNISSSIQGDYFHKNFVEYLSLAYGAHRGVVIDPHVIWYTVLSEIATYVKDNAEECRSLFTDSPDKKEIMVQSGSLTEMPLDTLMMELDLLVPTDVSVFFPSFSTATPAYEFAAKTAFADMVSPYYNYSMYLCGFPKIMVRGTDEDWARINNQIAKIKSLIPGLTEYFNRVTTVITNISSDRTSEFWKDMFYLERCGSGHQEEVKGWIRDLFLKNSFYSLIGNFPSGVSSIDYKQMETKRRFSLCYGLFSSVEDGDYLIPDFGSVINEYVDAEVEVEQSNEIELNIEFTEMKLINPMS